MSVPGRRGSRMLRHALPIATSMVLSTGADAQAAVISGTGCALDGDTLKLDIVSVRLHGIDAPEVGQRCQTSDGGRRSCDAAATDRLAELVDGREIRCEVLDVDGYGRLVATCDADGEDLGRLLVEEGLAWAFVEYSDDYVSEEAGARAAGVGIWRDGADLQTSWDYRADRWASAAAASPRPGCPIKGNIGVGGDKIYHTPWSKYYSRTRIDESAGEEWFCNEAEAILAGWRVARSR